MPGKARFGSGSLVGPVKPLPDDDELPQRPTTAPAAPVVAQAAPVAEPRKKASAAAAPAAAAPPATSGRGRPPGTLRLNDAAGAALWEAFVVAKHADPFLSYRQFASQVVLQGLRRTR